jgi:hypothetical protein
MRALPPYAERDLSSLLRRTIEQELPFLSDLTDEQASARPNGPASWSPKQELGHLIDSAANNHMRFVGAALESKYEGPGYAQNDWVEIHAYQEISWEALTGFWFRYNVLLVMVIARIPRDRFETPCIIGESAPVPLGFVIEDYILHMRHHLDHILARAAITQYPSPSVAV